MSGTTLKIADEVTGAEERPAKLPQSPGRAQQPIDRFDSLPAQAPTLTIQPLYNGQYVVKATQSTEFLQLGEEEHFLLSQLNGENDAATVCASYEGRFGQMLSLDEFEEFLELAREHHLLRSDDLLPDTPANSAGMEAVGSRSTSSGNSLLYFRKSLFDPDSLFSWLVPKISFFWSRTFLAFSAALIVFAVALVWTHRLELTSQFGELFRWESLVLAWVVFLLVSVIHEFAHGLTCKRFGGEVHEVGMLMIFLMPCMYCDVSSAWLFPEKSRRMWVMFAGVYFELFLWGMAAIVWRVTLPHTFCNDLALVLLSLCGLQTLLNLVPFIKLDGYFLLSDWLEVPNLRQRALARLGGNLKWIFFGTARPEREPRSGLLIAFGLLCALFSAVVLLVVAVAIARFVSSFPELSAGFPIALGVFFVLRTVWKKQAEGEGGMISVFRYRRPLAWSLSIASIIAALQFMEVEDRVGGPCEIRPMRRAELRVVEAGFLTEILVEEGDRVSEGQPIARLEIPDLDSRRRQKRMEVDEAAARLKLLTEGTRPEEIAEQRRRIERARAWRDQASEDLNRDKQALAAEIDRLDHQCQQFLAELKTAEESLVRLESLSDSRAVTGQEMDEARRRADVARSQWEQAEAQAELRKALGTRETLAGLDARSELVNRENQLADLEATLKLMEAGSRQAEIEAAQAQLARLREQEENLDQLAARLVIQCPISGVVTTARLRERLGQFLHPGDLVCVVEDLQRMEIEIQLSEQDVNATCVGQVVELRARAMPHKKFEARVSRLGAAAAKGDAQSTVTIYCEIDNPDSELRSGMTGFARVFTGRRPLGTIAADRVLRFFRTQYWFWPW